MSVLDSQTHCRALELAGNEGEARLSRMGSERSCKTGFEVALLTGGGDRPYALGLTSALSQCGIAVDFIASNDLDLPEVHSIPHITFRNLRGDQRPNVSPWRKVVRVLTYYARLIRYAATAQPRIFHILWNDKFEVFDRTLLMLYYKLLGRKIVFTAHNVNARKRDAKDTWLNRLSLRTQYELVHHIFVHTAKMKTELTHDFCVSGDKVSVIPLGLNNTVPISDLTTEEAKSRLGIGPGERVMLFFGRIAPYKGLEYLISALAQIANTRKDCRLIIAGSIKDDGGYWQRVQQEISRSGIRNRIIERIEFIPDDQTELYFKAADVLILPYTEIFQSGVLVLAYSFGLPVIAADVGSLREDIVEGKTGYVFRPKDSADLAKKIEAYFSSPLFRELPQRRQEIRDYANERYSWNRVGEMTKKVYETLLNDR